MPSQYVLTLRGERLKLEPNLNLSMFSVKTHVRAALGEGTPRVFLINRLVFRLAEGEDRNGLRAMAWI